MWNYTFVHAIPGREYHTETEGKVSFIRMPMETD